ncbi:MAG: TolC family protein [Kordiimonadaceae bacterium]|nr:TolC family protein [Kordiimonadaceae bacterium]
MIKFELVKKNMLNVSRCGLSRVFLGCVACVGYLSLGVNSVDAGNGGAGDELLLLTPSDAIALSIKQNPASGARKSVVKAQQAELKAVSGWVPELNLKAETTYGGGEPTSFFATQGKEAPEESVNANDDFSSEPNNHISGGGHASVSVDVVLPIFANGVFFNWRSPGVLIEDGRYSKVLYEAESAEIELAYQVMEVYVAVLRAQSEVEILNSIFEHRTKQLKLMSQRIQSGESPVTDEYALKKALASSVRDLSMTRRWESLKLIELRLLLGVPLTQGLQLEGLLDKEIDQLPPLEELLEDLLKYHPQLSAQQAKLEIASAEVKSVEADSIPTLSMVSSVTAADSIKSTGIRDFYSVGLTLNVPLTVFARRNTLSASKAHSLQESQYELEVLSDVLTGGVYAAYYGFLDAEDGVIAQKKILEQSLANEAHVAFLYEENEADIDSVISAQDDALGSKLALVAAQFQTWSSYAQLFKSIGRPFGWVGMM